MMDALSKVYQRTVLNHPVAVLSVFALVFSFFSYHAKNFKLDASADSLMLEDDRDLKIFREVNQRYAVKEFLVVTFTPFEDLFSKEVLSQVKRLRDALEPLESVDSVVTLLDLPLLKASASSLSEITETKIKTLEDPDVDVGRARSELLESPVYRNLVLGEDGRTTGMMINLKADVRFAELFKERNSLLIRKRQGTLTAGEQDRLQKITDEYEVYYDSYNERRHALIEKIRSVLRPFGKYGTVHLGGVPMIADDMITFIKSDLVVFGLGVFIFIVVTLTILFREIRWVALPLMSCFCAVLVMIGVLGFLNWKVTVISSNFISLMLILTMSMNIHLAVRYRQLCRDMPSDSQTDIVFTMAKKMVWPCLYTALTTILAFCSLVFSGIRPVIDFGWMMTIGLCVTFLTSFVLFPAVLVMLRKSNSRISDVRQSVVTSRLAWVAESHGVKVIVISLVLAVVSVAGILCLKVENSFINYFREKTEIYQGLKLIDEKLGGTTPLDIILHFDEPRTERDRSAGAGEANDEAVFNDDDFGWVDDYDPRDYWFTPFKIERIKAVHDYADGLPEVGKVLSLASVLRVVEGLNDGREFDGLELGVLYKKVPDQMKSEMIDPYVSIDNNEARISLRIKDSLKNIRRKELLEKISGDLSEKFGFAEDRVTISGLLVLYNNMLQSLFRSQILTLGIVMLGIAAMLLVLFRSVMLSVIGIIPNLLAVGIVLGIMGLANIPLDMMTITIAAITMGIAIDNSIHYIYRFKEEFAANGSYGKTLHICHGNVGKAVLNTSVTIIFGFSILILSNFIPTIYFGIFTGLAMFIALLAVLTLLPKLILLWKPFKSQSAGGPA